jgi:hypothetical protein
VNPRRLEPTRLVLATDVWLHAELKKTLHLVHGIALQQRAISTNYTMPSFQPWAFSGYFMLRFPFTAHNVSGLVELWDFLQQLSSDKRW